MQKKNLNDGSTTQSQLHHQFHGYWSICSFYLIMYIKSSKFNSSEFSRRCFDFSGYCIRHCGIVSNFIYSSFIYSSFTDVISLTQLGYQWLWSAVQSPHEISAWKWRMFLNNKLFLGYLPPLHRPQDHIHSHNSNNTLPSSLEDYPNYSHLWDLLKLAYAPSRVSWRWIPKRFVF